MNSTSIELWVHWMSAWEVTLRTVRLTALCSMRAALVKGCDLTRPKSSHLESVQSSFQEISPMVSAFKGQFLSLKWELMSSAKDRDFSRSEREGAVSMVQGSCCIRSCLLYSKTQWEWIQEDIPLIRRYPELLLSDNRKLWDWGSESDLCVGRKDTRRV